MATRKELKEAVSARYKSASAAERTRILDEFVAVTGYHRKHAIRVLGSGAAYFGHSWTLVRCELDTEIGAHQSR